MPTRLEVLLHNRKSAAAGRAEATSVAAASAQSTSAPATLWGKLTRRISGSIPPLKPDSGSKPGSVNDNGAEVGDVGERRAGREQVADAVEKPRGIVVGKKRGRIEAVRLGPCQGRIVDKGASRVVRPAATAVGAVGVGRKRRYPFGAAEMDGKRQRIFLVGSALAVSLERDRKFAARQEDDAASGRGVILRQRGMRGGDLPGFALQAVAEDDAVETGLAHACRRRGK